VLENGEQWDYDYDAMGQVISGQKKDAAGQPVPGTQFGYAYDGIGNRTSATVNGRTGTYTADAANQYTQRQVPGAVDIRGSASPAAKVTVNGQNTQRLGDSFYKALTVDNSTAPQYPGVSVLAVRQAAGPNGEDVKSETFGNLFLAKTPEVFTHDAEGNLTADGRWSYTWDGEKCDRIGSILDGGAAGARRVSHAMPRMANQNRLIRMETLAAVPAAAKRKLDFAYDAHSRRIRKQVSTWNGSAWVLQSDRRYLYDGWNLVAELDAANTMLRTYTWGLDLSRTPQGAGGVGGLLAIHEGGESYLPAYDGNGNVMALVKASDQSVAARYEYGPFGETLMAQESGISNPFRFSTKFQDGESGLYYYGYRYLDTQLGRWLSRDPIGERGGINVYSFADNQATNYLDMLGLVKKCCCVDSVSIDPKSIKEKENVTPPALINAYKGHQFTVNIKLSYNLVVDSAKNCDCKLEWWEWSTEPLPYGQKKAKVWEDGAAAALQTSNTLAPWRTRGLGNDVSITDIPSISSLSKERFGKTRELYIFIRVSSGLDCDCKNKSKEAKMYQKLTLKDGGVGIGEVDEKNSEIKQVEGDFGKDTHGGWPK
jgi:RHS repeat-associated protein